MAMTVVDRLEAVEVDEQQRGLRAVALYMGERALEFALETAAVEDIEQGSISARASSSPMRARATVISRLSRSISASSGAVGGKSSCPVLRLAEDPCLTSCDSRT